MKTTTSGKTLSKLATIWDTLHGPGKAVSETPEQRIVRKWLQGKASWSDKQI